MSHFENKLVAVMNKSIEPGKILNALAHMCIAFGSKFNQEKLLLVDYISKQKNVISDMSKMPFIILRANNNKIKNLRENAIQKNIAHSVFTDTMTCGTWEEQVERTAETDEDNLIYFGIVMHGDYKELSEMTSKFSLWK